MFSENKSLADILRTSGGRILNLIRVLPPKERERVSSVIEVGPDGRAVQHYSIGNQVGLTPAETVDALENRGIRLQKKP